MERLKLQVRASQVSCSDREDYVYLVFKDTESSVEFLEIELSFAEFGKLVKSNSTLKVEGKVRGLDVLGKKYKVERRTISVPKDVLKGLPAATSHRDALEDWLLCSYVEEGWNVRAYLGSQNSISSSSDNLDFILNFSVYRWE